MIASGSGFCDVPGCDQPWLFVEHRNKVPIRRRCHRHWNDRPKPETLRLVPRVTPRNADPET